MLGSRCFMYYFWKCVVLMIAVIVATTACGGGQDESVGVFSPVTADSDGLISLMRDIGQGFDYQPHSSPAVLGNSASITVIGTVVDVADGRVFGVGESRKTEPAFLNLTYTVKVESVVEGDQSLVRDGRVYVEIPRTKAHSVKSFQDAIPKNQRLLLFLDDYTAGLRAFPVVEQAPSIPAGAPVLAPYTEGFLIEDVASGRLIGGFEDLSNLALAWSEGTTTLDKFKATHFAGNELME